MTLVCESQYLSKDRDLALKNGHMTALDTGRLARMANVETLILIHISDRYSDDERLALLAEARSEFPNTTFPLEWNSPHNTSGSLKDHGARIVDNALL